MNSDEDKDMLPEYDLSKLGKGVRGKYAKRFAEGVTYVAIENDLAEDFSDAKAVNDALREYRRIKQKSA